MKQLFVIGPSGVGRTTLCKKLADVEQNVVHVSFDEQVKLLINAHYELPQHRSGEEGREFWRFCKGVITNLTNNLQTDITLVFDVDAGAEYIPECQEYLLDRRDTLICVMASADVIYAREIMRAAEVGNPQRTKDVFLATEFSPELQKLYDAAAITIDITNEDLHSAVAEFRNAVMQLAAQ